MAANRVYFPNLNGVRFLAALLVIIHHIEMAKYWFHQPNVYANSFVGGLFGELGIILFFVLSGFLITYLLLEEHNRTQTIAIKDFYVRRILRIWPVYYLIVILALFIIPQFHFFDIPGFSEYVQDVFWWKSLAYLTFLPNLSYDLFEHIPYATQTWSVGVEEQFYLVWPLLMLWGINKKKVMHVLVGTIITYLVFKSTAVYYYASDLSVLSAEKTWLLIDHFSIDCMAMGGIGAYLLYYNKQKALDILFNKYLQWTVYIVLAITTLKGWSVPWFNKEWYGVLFTVVILNLAANKKSVISLELKPLNYLGKISYGLYMYHNLILTTVLKIIMVYSLADLGTIWGNILYYSLAIGLTIVCSGLSYQYFEKWFLALKSKYAKVESGEKLSPAVTPQTDLLAVPQTR